MAVSYYERDGYYAKNDPEHRQASFWYGDAAKALGLKAHVRPSRFTSVLSGYVPGTDLRLGRMREGEHEHRPGWDITLSAPKFVSLEALVMGDRRAIRAHDEAVRATLDFVEAELLETRGWDPATRRRPRVRVNGMVVAGFRHLASRDQDPQLHTHCVLANMTRTASGRPLNVIVSAVIVSRALSLQPTGPFAAPAQEEVERNDYVFERRVDYKFDDGTTARRRIDLYKRDCFVMEAKQSAKRVEAKKADPDQLHLTPEDATKLKPGAATRGTGRWDKVMRAAKRQAEDYARALPKEHGWPPFILVVDVGHVIEVYADFSGQGKNYAQFPDRDDYSIPLAGLRDQAVRDRLRAIWSAPHALDPAKRSAEVTRDIAERLARIALSLEGKHDAKEVAEFLMRCLFTMFAEDVGLPRLSSTGTSDVLEAPLR